MKNKPVLSVLSITAMTTIITSALSAPAFAANGDIYNLNNLGTPAYTQSQTANFALQKTIGLNSGSYGYEYTGKVYNFDDLTKVYDAQGQDFTKTMTALPTSATPAGDAGQTTPTTALTVSSVGTINATNVTVTLANVPTVLPAGSAFTVTDTNSNTYAVTAIAPSATAGQYILTLGTAVTGKGTLTVAYGSSSQNNVFDTTVAGETLSISIPTAKNGQLASDGADNTMVTVQALKNGVLDTTITGTVKFLSLQGATFAKTEVAFNQGIATVQLTSIASAKEVDDIISATINNASDVSLIGKSGTMAVKYVPSIQPVAASGQVYVTNAIGNTSGDVSVTFNSSVDFSKLYADWLANGNGVITVKSNGVTKTIEDIKNTGSTSTTSTVDLVLAEGQALTDNSTITVTTAPSLNPTTAAFLPNTVNYNLVDASAPAAFGVTNPDYRTIVAQFNEPIVDGTGNALHDALNPSNWVLNGTQLTAQDVIAVAPATTGIVAGKLLADGITVSPYVKSATAPVDNRCYVTITLAPAAKGVLHGLNLLTTDGTKNLLQAYNISDYAGLTDTTGQNYATTQEFSFATPAAPSAPTATITEDSPEQYEVTFNQSLVAPLTATDFGLVYQNGSVVAGTTTPDFKTNVVTGKATDTDTYTANKGNPIAIPLENSGKDTGSATVIPVPNTNNEKYVINVNEDWTVRDNTATSAANYYAPNYNNVQVTVAATDAINAAGVKMAAAASQVLTLSLDSTSPTIINAVQEVDANKAPAQFFDVTMSEPVQMSGTIGDSAILTPSQTQGKVIPTPTFQFVSSDNATTVDGVLSTAIDATNTKYVIAPKTDLTTGTWILYIRSISDQVGNTSSTISYPINVVDGTVATGTPTIVSAYAYDNVTTTAGITVGKPDPAVKDVVTIQFGTTMSSDALKSTMYTVNGNALPVGTMITSQTVKYDTKNNISGTLVTITLPNTFLGDMTTTAEATFIGGVYTNPKTPNILNISKSLTSTSGAAITGNTQVQMSYNTLPQ